MLIFLGTELTKLARPDLISLALVAEDGHGFYGERTDFYPKDCSDFVQQTVLPLLGRIPNAACSRMELTHRLRDWVGQLSEPATFVFDSAHDWHLLAIAMLGRPQKTPPSVFGKQLFLDSAVFAHPVFEGAANEAYTLELPIHHALADARSLRAGYKAWTAASERLCGSRVVQSTTPTTPTQRCHRHRCRTGLLSRFRRSTHAKDIEVRNER